MKNVKCEMKDSAKKTTNCFKNAVLIADAQTSDHENEHLLQTVGAWMTVHLQRMSSISLTSPAATDSLATRSSSESMGYHTQCFSNARPTQKINPNMTNLVIVLPRNRFPSTYPAVWIFHIFVHH